MDGQYGSCEGWPMSAGFTDIANPTDLLEDYRAVVTELHSNVERLKELVEVQILLETPPVLRRYSHSDSSEALLELGST
jgi:hypothetical protein